MAQGVNGARARTGEWKLWRFELTAYGKYVELSFEDVVLHTEADVVRWSRELMTAFEHYGRPVDLLVDLRGLRLGNSCGPQFGRGLSQMLGRHAAAAAVYGADERMTASIDPPVCAIEFGHCTSGRDEALAWLMKARDRRRRASAEPAPLDERVRPRQWEGSEATNR